MGLAEAVERAKAVGLAKAAVQIPGAGGAEAFAEDPDQAV